MINWIRESLSSSNIISDSSYSISPQSTIQIQVSPKDPSTSSNIILTAYRHKQNNMLIPVRVKWFRSKCNKIVHFSQQHNLEIEQIKDNNSPIYRCDPSDLGYFLYARVQGIEDDEFFANIIIGPIKIDPIIKVQMQKFMAHELFSSAINIISGEQRKQGRMNISTKILEISSIFSNERILKQYNISNPKIQINKKVQNSILIGFQEDSKRIKRFVNSVFHPEQKKLEFEEEIQQNMIKSKSRIFKQNHQSIIQIEFHTRQDRDCFLIMRKAFLCKQSLKNSVIFEQIQQMQKDSHDISLTKFLEFMNLKEDIHRLYSTAKAIQLDRNKKIKDISNLQESIDQVTHTYLKIIEDIGNKEQHNLNESYSNIANKRQEIIQKKQIRTLRQENLTLHKKISLLQGQLNQIKSINRKTRLQYGIKKLMNSRNLEQSLKQFNKYQRSESITQHKESKKLMYESPTKSNQLANPQEITDNSELIKQLRQQICSLKIQIEILKTSTSRRLDLSQSVSSFKNSFNNIICQGYDQNFNFQPTIASQADLKLMEQKFHNLYNLNQRLLEENNRIRKERQNYKEIARSYRIKYKELEQVHEKNKKTLKDLIDEVEMLRRNADALDRSRNLSQDMQLYYQDELNILRKEMELLINQKHQIQLEKSKIEQQFRNYKKVLDKKEQMIALNDL